MKMASNFEGANGGLSMLEKSLERRRVNKEHNSNFRAGHVPVNEEHLHKTGLRGRKRFFAYLILALVFIAALANLGMTVMIMLVLNINWDGLEPLSFMRNGLLRFNDPTDIDLIFSRSGQIGSYQAQDLILSAVDEASSIKLQNTARSGSSLEVSGDETVMVATHGFEIIHPETGKSIFKMPGAREEMEAPPGEYTTLQATTITTPMVRSDTGQDLLIKSEKKVTLQGNEGLVLNSKKMNFKADMIELRPQAGLVLDSGPDHGIYINTTLLDKSAGNIANRPTTATTYKLCVCETSGLIFRVETGAPHPCAYLDAAHNPCTL